MANPAPRLCTTLSGVPPTLMDRIYGNSNVLVTQASITSITYTVYLMSTDYPTDEDTKTAVTGHSAITVTKTSAVFDALQTGGTWTDSEDATGYNFKHQVDVSVNACFATAGRYYKVVYTFTPASGQKFTLEWVVFVKG